MLTNRIPEIAHNISIYTLHAQCNAEVVHGICVQVQNIKPF